MSSDVCSPLMWSLYEAALEQSMPGYFKEIGLLASDYEAKWGRIVFARPYWNLAEVKAVLEGAGCLPALEFANCILPPALNFCTCEFVLGATLNERARASPKMIDAPLLHVCVTLALGGFEIALEFVDLFLQESHDPLEFIVAKLLQPGGGRTVIAEKVTG